MAYKQNGINIFGTGGVETGKSKGKSLGADELQKKFGERIEVPISTPKNKQQDTLDGSMNFQEELSNKMNADSGYIAPVRALQSKKDGFEKARNRGNKAIAADGSFSSLGIATAQNILSGAKEGISKFKEKRAAKIAADPKRAKIKDLKSQLKEGRKLGRAEKKGNRQDKKIAKLEGKLGIAATPKTTPKATPKGNGKSLITPAVSTSIKKTKSQAPPTRFTKVPIKAKTSSKSSGGSGKSSKPASIHEGKQEAFEAKENARINKARKEGLNKYPLNPEHPNMKHHPDKDVQKPTAAQILAARPKKNFKGKQKAHEDKQARNTAAIAKVKSENFNMSKYK